MEQVYYEDVQIGTEVPPFTKRPTTRQLVKWAGASGDFYEIHYDKDFAQGKGLPEVIVHGRLKAAFLGQLMTDWVGRQGALKRLACRYGAVDFHTKPLTCKGRVVKKYEKDAEFLVECEVWIENSSGQRTTTGTAVVSLPSKHRA